VARSHGDPGFQSPGLPVAEDPGRRLPGIIRGRGIPGDGGRRCVPSRSPRPGSRIPDLERACRKATWSPRVERVKPRSSPSGSRGDEANTPSPLGLALGHRVGKQDSLPAGRPAVGDDPGVTRLVPRGQIPEEQGAVPARRRLSRGLHRVGGRRGAQVNRHPPGRSRDGVGGEAPALDIGDLHQRPCGQVHDPQGVPRGRGIPGAVAPAVAPGRRLGLSRRADDEEGVSTVGGEGGLDPPWDAECSPGGDLGQHQFAVGVLQPQRAVDPASVRRDGPVPDGASDLMGVVDQNLPFLGLGPRLGLKSRRKGQLREACAQEEDEGGEKRGAEGPRRRDRRHRAGILA